MRDGALTWWWIFWSCLIGARNPAGAKYWAMRKLIDEGWIKGEFNCARGHGGPPSDWWRRNQWSAGSWRRFVYWWRNGPIGKAAVQIHDWGWQTARARGYDRVGRCTRWIGELFNWTRGGTRWEWPWQPRTCSFCGGAHPEDIIQLISEGWEVEATTKAYKRYIEPPRTGTRTITIGAHCDGHEIAERAWGAVPPVKLYVQHFSPEQLRRFNAMVDSRRIWWGKDAGHA